MKGGRPFPRSAPLRTVLICAVLVPAGLTGCSTPRGSAPSGIADPPGSIPARPDYSQACAPSGLDSSPVCEEVTLQAIDDARSGEGLGPLVLPAGFPGLGLPEQLLAVLDQERVDRKLPPFDGISAALDQAALTAAAAGVLPPDPGSGYASADTEWLGASPNPLDADYAWLYDDGPGGGLPDCTATGDRGCWVDRHIVLDAFGSPGTLVLGVGSAPIGDRTAGDRGGPSLAVILARTSTPGTLVAGWSPPAAGSPTLVPRRSAPADASATGIPDPAGNVVPRPDFTSICAQSGLDSSAPCLAAVLASINGARALEGVKPMVLPAIFGRLSTADQLFVVVNLERVDRGLPPFAGLTAGLDANARKGADSANDPPDPGSAYADWDSEWAGGSANGLDADYGLMYDDGIGSGNLDCPAKGGSGCWGHRHGILDNLGTVGTLVMGAALNPTGDTNEGDRGGTSMAFTLAIVSPDSAGGTPPLLYSWAQVLAGQLPPGA